MMTMKDGLIPATSYVFATAAEARNEPGIS